MSASDEQILDELMAKNAQVVKSAKQVLEETKLLMAQITKQERCRNLEYQMMSSSQDNVYGNLEGSKDVKNRFLLDLKMKREMKLNNNKSIRNLSEYKENQNLCLEANKDKSISIEQNQEIKSIEFNKKEQQAEDKLKVKDMSFNGVHDFPTKRIESHPHESDANDVNTLIYPREKMERKKVEYKFHHSYPQVQAMYQPVIFLPYMYQSQNQMYHPLSHQQHPDHLPNTIDYLHKENAQQSGSDDEINGTRIIMKNKKSGYVCNLCGKIYCRKYVLKIHQRVHSGEKPLTCHICGKCFSDPSNLKKHVRLHDPEQAYLKCHLCPRQYTRRRSLLKHLESFHTNQNGVGQVQEGYMSAENSPENKSANA